MAAAAGIAASGLLGTSTSARQSPSPVASPAAVENPREFLFVQSFESGELSLTQSTDGGKYTLTLNAGLEATLFFSDRPERIVGTVPTPRFLDTLGFQADNPPNAALVADKGNGDQDVFVELLDPSYDKEGRTTTYEVNILQEDERVDLHFQGEVEAAPAAATYGSSHLFIDDCPDDAFCCRKKRTGAYVGAMTIPMCWEWRLLVCNACHDISASECDIRFPTQCHGDCKVDTC